jgi:hypothetical protein
VFWLAMMASRRILPCEWFWITPLLTEWGLIGDDGIKTEKGEAKRDLQLAATVPWKPACDMQLFHYQVHLTIWWFLSEIKVSSGSSQNHFRLLLSSALSRSLTKVDAIEHYQDVLTIFTFLPTDESPNILIVRVLNTRLNTSAVVAPAVMVAWWDKTSNTLG